MKEALQRALVFLCFSGSHQDAIAKGNALERGKIRNHWTVPYLPGNPTVWEEIMMQM